MAANPGSVLLLDEPDARMEILRQRQIHSILTETASRTDCQIAAVGHSEVVLGEAGDRDTVIAFVGRPHRIDDRGSQLHKALSEFGFEHYLEAEETGWVLYLEGSTDLAILRTLAERLHHAVATHLERLFVHYVTNQPQNARKHFYALREAKRDLVGVALYDRLDIAPQSDPDLTHMVWKRRGIENCLCRRGTLRAFAEAQARDRERHLFSADQQAAMDDSIEEIASALGTLGRPDPWSDDAKASDEFLDPVFRKYYAKLGLPNTMSKTNYHVLASFVDDSELSPEIREKLDRILEVASPARPRGREE